MLKISLIDSINVSININGANTFADIDCLYIKEPAKNELAEFYFYFKSVVIKESVANNSNNNDKNQVQATLTDEDMKMMVSMCVFSDNFSSRKDKIYSLLSKVAFKDEELKQPINQIEIDKLALEDLQEVASSFLSKYWVARWLKEIQKNNT